MTLSGLSLGPLWWALALGACLGGNGTPVGASANVTAIGLAEKAGARITFREFTRFGSRVTAATLVVSSLFVASYIFMRARNTFWTGVALIAVILMIRVFRPGRPIVNCSF